MNLNYQGGKLFLGDGRLSYSTDSVHFPTHLEYGENEAFLKVFVLSYLAVLCDSPLEPDGKKPDVVIRRFYNKLVNDDLRSTIKRYSGYAHTLLQQEYVTGGDSTTGVFLEFMKDLPIFKEYLVWYRTGRPELLRYILSFLLYGKKLDFVDAEFDAIALRDWHKVEEKLNMLELDDNDVASLANIVAVILPPLSSFNFLPRFGPGNVSEAGVTNVIRKLNTLSADAKLAYVLTRQSQYGLDERGMGDALRVFYTGNSSKNVARLKFVPKDISKSRSICMEPNAYMFAQQGFLKVLVEHMEKGLISKFVDLHNQLGNQEAAIHGSTYLSSDTLDLSSASDSVSIDLVRKVFPASYLRYLLGTRTSNVRLPDGKVVKVKKFAPMGSALCFPVQCIIFTAISILAYMKVDLVGDGTNSQRGLLGLTSHGPEGLGEVLQPADVRAFIKNRLHRTRSSSTPFTWRYEPPIVYGDDIVCDSRVTRLLTSYLESFGFTVNVSKSFTGSQAFRESCGVFAFLGQDVTPILFRVRAFKQGPLDAGHFASLIEEANKCGDNGFRTVHSFLVNLLKDCAPLGGIPFVTDRDQFGIFTRCKKPVEARYSVWHRHWQCWEEKVLGIRPRKIKEAVTGDLEAYRYTLWWRSRTQGSVHAPEGYGLRVRAQETRVVPVWTRYEK